MSVFARNGHGGNGAGGPGVERAVGERSSGAGVRPLAEAPDPELTQRAQRRRFTSAYKLAIVREADSLAQKPGEIGALLRREGLYSSSLSKWRQRQRAVELDALSPRKRGPEPDPAVPFKKRIADLEREVERLQLKLRQAETIIDVQKKVSGLLGTQAEKGNGKD